MSAHGWVWRDAGDVQVGDDVVFLGRIRRVVEIRPYVGSLVESGVLPADTRTAVWADGERITLVPGQLLHVVPAVAA